MSKYTYFRPMGDRIIIMNDKEKIRPYEVSELRRLASDPNEIEEIRDMALGALREFGLLGDGKQEEDPASDTIVTIDHIKVYMNLYTRAFFAIFKGTRLYGSLSDLEKRIRKGA